MSEEKKGDIPVIPIRGDPTPQMLGRHTLLAATNSSEKQIRLTLGEEQTRDVVEDVVTQLQKQPDLLFRALLKNGVEAFMKQEQERDETRRK